MSIFNPGNSDPSRRHCRGFLVAGGVAGALILQMLSGCASNDGPKASADTVCETTAQSGDTVWGLAQASLGSGVEIRGVVDVLDHNVGGTLEAGEPIEIPFQDVCDGLAKIGRTVTFEHTGSEVATPQS